MNAAAGEVPRVRTPVGGRTHWEVGGPPTEGATEVRAPSGVIAYEPADMTITVGAGTSFDELDRVLAANGQECALDPRSRNATIGGILACGLSGPRRLRHGPVRDHVLEVRFETADGRVVKGGGPTVKNVTGYDIPRLFVGSLGTIGILRQATLRCRPRFPCARWFTVPEPVSHTVDAFRASARLWNGRHEALLLEGVDADVAAQSRGLAALTDSPMLPDGPHRGRISVRPGRVRDCAGALDGDVRWCAEVGVGTIHVATDDAGALVGARSVAHAHGGWMLREAGGPADDDGFGVALPNAPLLQRIKEAFDPDWLLNPDRMPLRTRVHA
jgi:FAD/FMN-containing dehydrogenase